MSALIKSFFREEAKLYFLYMVAGAAAVPAGICYAILAIKGWERWWTVIPLLALGLAMALFAWKYLEKRLYSWATVLTVSQTHNARVYVFGFKTAGALAAASMAALCSLQPNQSNNQTESGGQGNDITVSSHTG